MGYYYPMMSQRLFKRAFLVLLVTAVLNWFVSMMYLHWTIWWIDIILHFLGGLSVALFFLWFCATKFDLKNWSSRKILFAVLGCVILVGVLWELYELYFGLTFLSDGLSYFADTFSDLIMDVVGGLTGFLYIQLLLKNNE